MSAFDLVSTPERSIVDFRRSGVAGAVRLGRYRYHRAQAGLPPHAHRGMLEICLLARGRQCYQVDGREYHLRGGDAFVVQPNETHGTGGAPEEKGVLYWLLVRPPGPGGWLGCDAASAHRLWSHLSALPQRHFPMDGDPSRLLDAIPAIDPGSDLAALRVENLLVRFLLAVVDAASRQQAASCTPAIAAALTAMEGSLDGPADLARCAAAARLSLSRFKARFAAETGIPPAEYHLRLRIGQAQDRLRQGRASITAIALDLGFASSQYFATAFRRITGMTPRQWSTRHGR